MSDSSFQKDSVPSMPSTDSSRFSTLGQETQEVFKKHAEWRDSCMPRADQVKEGIQSSLGQCCRLLGPCWGQSLPVGVLGQFSNVSPNTMVMTRSTGMCTLVCTHLYLEVILSCKQKPLQICPFESKLGKGNLGGWNRKQHKTFSELLCHHSSIR